MFPECKISIRNAPRTLGDIRDIYEESSQLTIFEEKTLSWGDGNTSGNINTIRSVYDSTFPRVYGLIQRIQIFL